MPRRSIKPILNERMFYNCPWTGFFHCKSPYDELVKYQKTNKIPVEKLVNHLHFDLKLDRQKAELLTDIYNFQDTIVKNDQEVNLMINLPFCLWRCFNCTRVMYDKTKYSDVYLYYIDALKKELKSAKNIIQKKCYLVQNVYFTGNLLALDSFQIEDILKNTSYAFSNTTVEVGSPLFITKEKLEILKKFGVKKIVFNSLTFNTVSLRQLCRRFEFKDLYNAYTLVISMGFETCFDLVIGLLDEKELQLKRNIELATDLGANNINLYARTCKYLKPEKILTKEEDLVSIRKLLNFSYYKMKEKGYVPYFIYNTEIENGCFENVGYSINDSFQNKFLIDHASEISTTISCGTLAESFIINNLTNSKFYFKNPYDISQYVFGIDELIQKKEKFFLENSLHNN